MKYYALTTPNPDGDYWPGDTWLDMPSGTLYYFWPDGEWHDAPR